MADSSLIDPSIFTSIDFTNDPKTLSMYSNVVAKAGFYIFEVTVKYDDYISPIVKLTATFTIELIECDASTLNINAAIWHEQEYFIEDEEKIIEWNPNSTGIS